MLFKGFRRVIKFIDFLRRVNPCFRLEHVDVVFAVHHIQIRTAEVFNQLSIFVVRVEDIYFFARHDDVCDDELHQVRFALAGVAKD